jgi:mRNA interferase MazF
MPSTTAFRRGDVVLVEYSFTDRSSSKRRPAVVVSSNAYHQAMQEVIVAAITSNIVRRLFGDYRIVDWQIAGLDRPSTLTGIVQAVRHSMIRRRIGLLAAHDLAAYDRIMRAMLDL